MKGIDYGDVLAHLIITGRGFCFVDGAIVDTDKCLNELGMSPNAYKLLLEFNSRLDESDVRCKVEEIRARGV